jgi:hypothetical protein
MKMVYSIHVWHNTVWHKLLIFLPVLTVSAKGGVSKVNREGEVMIPANFFSQLSSSRICLWASRAAKYKG